MTAPLDGSAGPQDCPICGRGEPLDVIADLGVAWVSAPPDAPLPAYVCLVAKRHVVEPFELDREAGHAFWDAAMDVARTLSRGAGATKLNYEIHGNTLRHLHLHLYPRYPGDPFEGGPIDGTSTTFHRDPGQLEALRTAFAPIGRPDTRVR